MWAYNNSMENSQKILFEDDKPNWYVALGESWIGPMTASDVYQKVVSQEISWAHFVWRQGQPAWQRICDTDAYKAVVPREPAQDLQGEVEQDAKPVIRPGARQARPAAPQAQAAEPAQAAQEQAREWFLYYNNAQFGPFTHEEVSRFLASGRIHPQVHCWKDGLDNWKLLESVGDFFVAVGQSKSRATQPATRTDQRQAPRAPLVAKILLSDDENVVVGVCRDVSVGGMQVLTDRLPGPVGTRVKLNVSPSSQTAAALAPFVAQGQIVRILEDGRGFSFRFEKLAPAALQAIESYISASS